MKYGIIDDCAFPEGLIPVLLVLKADTGCTYISGYRGSDAADLLHAHGKATQEDLWQAWLRGQGNPANPPGHSTHDLHDGSGSYPYGSPDGTPLPYWCCGIDISDSQTDGVIAAAARRGWEMWRPYSSGSEYHHLNFRAQPKPPPPPDPHHYLWMPETVWAGAVRLSPRAWAKEYDRLRATQTPTQHPNRARLAFLRGRLKVAAGRCWAVAHFSRPVAWNDGRHLGFQFQQYFRRSNGERLV